MKKEESSIFVGVKEPDELQKDILEASRDILTSLKGYEQLKGIKEKKISYISQLRKKVAETNRLLGQAKSLLPGSEAYKHFRSAEKARNVKEPTEKQKVEPTKDISEVDKLEAELNDIENKLNEIA